MRLYIDIETYSSVDITKAGTYKYIGSVDFEILLISYAFDNRGVKIIDIAQGDEIPQDFIDGIFDPVVEKWAHNAVFERLAFAAVGFDIPVYQWFCSSVKAAYCGLPLALDAVSKAMHLEEKGKLATGKALIKYFCTPCKPTKTNGFRSFNKPEHAPEKWGEFIQYCINDVIAMREICNRLEGYTIPESERQLYLLDQKINDTGIETDLSFAQNAFDIDVKYSKVLSEKMKELTQLENPNSPAQLKKWLSDATGKEITTLAKDTIPELIDEVGPGAVAEVLKLRQKSSKTSIKKYTKILDCTCDDGRAHGLFQFYGANRTGRWAGRLIQMQNLPQNHITDLQGARDIVAVNDYDLALLSYDDIPSLLSQLIRTAFVAKKNHTFAVADFSAIEARVIAWLAGEKWRMDVFNTHGKIYEASASMMFDIPIEEVTKGSDYRTTGKVAELALGYQGSVGAMTSMCKTYKVEMSEQKKKNTVDNWRRKSPAIVKLWATVDTLAKRAIKNPGARHYYKEGSEQNLIFEYDRTVLTIQLPSGRKLFYYHPTFSKNKWDRESIKYRGMNQETKQWGWVDTYGGKLVENCVQGIARDLLAFSMVNIDKAGFNIVMHVHDEAIGEVEDGLMSVDHLKLMCEVMEIRPDWAQSLPLVADGYLTPFYKKD
jgi:DNA polymerase